MAVIYALLEVHLNNVHKLFVRKKYSNHRRNRHYFSANGPFSLLPLALKWGLFIYGVIAILPCLICEGANAASLELSVPSTVSLTVAPDGELHSQESGTIKITSDAYAGYTFTISSKDKTNALKDGDHIIPSITAESDDNSFAANSWGFKWSGNGKTSSKYLPGPTTGTEIDKTITANEDKANEYTIILGAKVDYNTVPGAYSNTFVLAVTANNVPYTITYDGNGADNGVPNTQSGTAAEGTNMTIGAAPTRAGYGFRGWCDQDTEDEICNGKVYYPDLIYSLENNENKLNLHAMWVQASTMQDWNGCSSLTEHETVYLTDTRDNNTYKVRKLKDGKCWMVENLKISGKKLTSADSDVTDDFTLPISNLGDGFNHYDTSYVWIADGLRSRVENGGYYSWFAATVGEGLESFVEGNTQHSICPKGWKLPSGNNNSDFSGLASSYGSTPAEVSVGLRSPDGPNFLLSGRISNATLDLQDEGVYYWSTTAYDAQNAYSLYINATSFAQQWQNTKYFGRPVRCLLREEASSAIDESAGQSTANSASDIQRSIDGSTSYINN